ncbi:hypothetical protein [Nocardioides daejeonensis]|uniref:hypothetical protein n=1 Tax=Nocardioides daejeonensis TaxID=1046556 RepID=UPI000D74ACA4|nr:hypothetical protein [Nocardioides daejeonensis]
MRTFAGLVAVLLLLVGCSGDDKAGQEVTELTPLPATDPHLQPIADRDVNAVSASLSMLDPCALLRISDRKKPTVFATGQCDANGVKIELNATLYSYYRFDILREEIGGFVSYRVRTADGCTIWLPTTQERAIRVQSHRSCAPAREVAAQVVDVLDHRPEAVVRRPSPNRMPTCAPFAAAYPRADVRPVDNMSVWDQCVATQGKKSLGTLDFTTADFSSDSDPRFQVGETEVTRNTVLKNCWYIWPAWRTDYPAANDGQVYARLQRSGACRTDDPVLKRVVAATHDAKAVEAPVTDLLYPWGSDDTAAPGACRDAVIDDCLPATPAEAPSEPAELIARGEVDPAVLCAATAPLVSEHFGSGFSPVTGALGSYLRPPEKTKARRCVFVNDAHSLQIEVLSSVAPLHTGDTEVAGHPAASVVDQIDTLRHDRTWTVAWRGAEDPGSLQIVVRAQRARGQLPQGPDPDLTLPVSADAFVDDLVTTLLD